MNSRTRSYITTGVLLLLGTTLIGLRYRAIHSAQTAREDSLWRLTYVIEFTENEAGAQLQIPMPRDTRHCEVVDWECINPGVGRERRGSRLFFTAPQAEGDYRIMAAFDLRLSPRAEMSRAAPMEMLSPDARARYLRNEYLTQGDNIKQFAQNALDQGGTPSEQVQWIFELCSDLGSGATASDEPDQILAVEGRLNATDFGRARTMVALCRSIRVPARLVIGFEIKQGPNVRPLVWVEVFLNQSWVPFDPVNGYSRYLPMQYVPVRFVGSKIGQVEIAHPVGASRHNETFSVVRIDPPPNILQTEVRHPIQILNLQRLPVPMHDVLSILLLLPLGALITAIMRNFVGIGTFGTFSPALLAMSFIYADWQTGLGILIVVVTAGVVSRALLERLRLLAVPRLSIILTTVILCVVFGISILHYMLPEISTEAVLLPMVILTMLIERFYVTTEEDGLMYTVQLATGTLVVALLCYMVLRWETVGAFVLVYPEAHFFTISAFIVLGRYAGYRITELWRFRDLVDWKETPP